MTFLKEKSLVLFKGLLLSLLIDLLFVIVAYLFFFLVDKAEAPARIAGGEGNGLVYAFMFLGLLMFVFPALHLIAITVFAVINRSLKVFISLFLVQAILFISAFILMYVSYLVIFYYFAVKILVIVFVYVLVRGTQNYTKILAGILISAVLIGLGALSWFALQPKPIPVTTPETATPSAQKDETANWKTYNGRYFSFKYPSSWTDNTGPASTYPENIEVIGLRIGVAVFEAAYKNYSYEKALEMNKNRISQTLKVDGRESTKFEYVGEGDPLPKDYSIISIVVRGTDDKSYLIGFNGPRKDITDELINQILSSFKFLD